MRRTLACAVALMSLPAFGQSLYSQRPVGAPVDQSGQPIPGQSLVGYSMLAITPPPPREIKRHDLITIIVNETSRSSRSQSMETEKKYDSRARLSRFPSLADLIEARVEAGELNSDNLLDIDAKTTFEGEGDYQRTDRLTTRIQAEVLDVKPNGTLVLEARTRIQTDEEIQVFVLSGSCRSEDITEQNTVQSSQLHNLSIISRNEGEVRRASKKGVIPRALEYVFAF